MKLSVVIPCYNMEAYLPRCLDSLLDQGMDPASYEVIVVNDESKDRTLEIARSYEHKHPQIKVIDKKNAGVGAARNTGFDATTGTYLYFLDPDDYLAKGVAPIILKQIEDKDLDILTFNSCSVKNDKLINSKDSLTDTYTPKVFDGISYIAHRKYKNEIWWFFVNRDFMKKTGIRFIEGKWMEDVILSAQLISVTPKIGHIDLDAHRYRLLPTSAMRNKTPEHYNKLIFDIANAAHVFDDLIKGIPDSHKDAEKCVKRLKTRQQSFVFFLLVRLMKSDLSVNEIPKMLDGFEKIDAYPLKKFLGPDYHGFSYSFMVFIFNNKPLIKPFVRFFRTFYRLVR